MLIKLPSVAVDRVLEDFLDATAGSLLSGNEAPFDLSDGDQLGVDVDGLGAQLITFHAADFEDISAATIEEVISVLTAHLTGARATDDGGKLRITTERMGAGGSVQITTEPAGPAFDFDAAVATGTDYTNAMQMLVNRVPEPGESGVPFDTTIVFDLYWPSHLAQPVGGVDVYLNGEQVVLAGVAYGGWGLSSSNPDSATLHVELTPPAAFESDELVYVRVVGTDFDETYSFHCLDHTRPRPMTAIGRDKKVIRLKFSEPVLMVDGTGAGDALNPSNYVIERASKPAVNVVPVSVAMVSESEVDITTDIEMTFGATYHITIVAVEDLAENQVVVAPDNELVFTAFVPAWPEGRRFLLREFIPAMNLAEDEKHELDDFIACLQELANVVLCKVDEWWQILDPDFAPEPFVDAILADLGNPFEVDLALVDKRRLIRSLVDIYKLAGTQPGIIDVIRFFTGIEVTIRTYNGVGWKLSQTGAPAGSGDKLGSGSKLGPSGSAIWAFRIVSPVDLDDSQRALMTSLVRIMKDVQSRFLGFIEPTEIVTINHLSLGHSGLGGTGGPGNWRLH